MSSERTNSAPSSSYEAVIFDWDGTLMDSTAHIVSALQATCRDLALPVPPDDEAGWVIGLSLQAALYRLVPDLGADRVDQFVARYREHHLRTLHEIRLFAGQDVLLRDLHAGGILLGVATGKSRMGLDANLAHLGLAPVFHATRTVDEARGKPDPDMLLQLLSELDLNPARVLMVGDTTHDIHMAHAAGVDSLAVTYGAHRPELLQAARPTALVSSVSAMQGWIRQRASMAVPRDASPMAQP